MFSQMFSTNSMGSVCRTEQKLKLDPFKFLVSNGFQSSTEPESWTLVLWNLMVEVLYLLQVAELIVFNFLDLLVDSGTGGES